VLPSGDAAPQGALLDPSVEFDVGAYLGKHNPRESIPKAQEVAKELKAKHGKIGSM
jgi:hypothetical protein